MGGDREEWLRGSMLWIGARSSGEVVTGSGDLPPPPLHGIRRGLAGDEISPAVTYL